MSLNVTHGHRKEETLLRREKSISVTSAPAVIFHSVHVVERAGTGKPSLLLKIEKALAIQFDWPEKSDHTLTTM
jgi:hypothetical protein